MKWLKSIGLSWLALFLLQAVLGMLLVSDAPQVEGSLPLSLVANLLTAGMLVVLARSLEPGVGRFLALFALWGGLQVMNLVETLFFNVEVGGDGLFARLLTFQVLVAIALSALIHRLAKAPTTGSRLWPAGARSITDWLQAIGGCVLVYVLCYVGAGMTVLPFVQEFYASRDLPGLPTVILIGGFRGLVFTGLLALLLRRQIGRRKQVYLLSGLAMSVLGGVAPLLPPNPYLPTSVRLAHLVEVGVSNFVFGWVAAFLLTRSRRQ